MRPGRVVAGKAEKRRSPEPFEEPGAYWRSRSRELGAFLEDKEGEGSSKLAARPSPSTPAGPVVPRTLKSGVRPILLRTLKSGARPVGPPDTEVWVSTCA